MNVCAGCGSPTGMAGFCLPCRKGVTSIRHGSIGPVLCRRCGEPLTDRLSRSRGYGSVCWKVERSNDA